MVKFSENETIQLVDLFVEQECLWNLCNISYRNKDMRLAAKKEIIDKLGKTGFGVSEFKQKIKNLRCTYNQECLKVKKSTKSGAGADDIYIPNIKWFNAFDRIMKLAKGEKKTDGCVETKISEIELNRNDEVDEEDGTVDEPATLEIQSIKAFSNPPASEKPLGATPEIQSSNIFSKTPALHKPPTAKRRKLENLTEAVQQLREVSQNIQDSSNNEHEAFGSFVAATLNNLRKADALMAQHEIQGVLLKYRLANVSNSTKNSQPTPCYSYESSLQSPFSNHSTDEYVHLQYGESTTSTLYADEPEQNNIEVHSPNLDGTSLANLDTNENSIISQALSLI